MKYLASDASTPSSLVPIDVPVKTQSAHMIAVASAVNSAQPYVGARQCTDKAAASPPLRSLMGTCKCLFH